MDKGIRMSLNLLGTIVWVTMIVGANVPMWIGVFFAATCFIGFLVDAMR